MGIYQFWTAGIFGNATYPHPVVNGDRDRDTASAHRIPVGDRGNIYTISEHIGDLAATWHRLHLTHNIMSLRPTAWRCEWRRINGTKCSRDFCTRPVSLSMRAFLTSVSRLTAAIRPRTISSNGIRIRIG